MKIFSAGDVDFFGEDVLLAGALWGDWPKLEQRVRFQLSCLKRMEETEDLLEDQELENAAAEFRYALDLLTAEETERWLQERGLDVESWMQHIELSLLQKKWSNELEKTIRDFPVSMQEVNHILESEAICSGEFGRLSYQLAGRAALYELRLEPESQSFGVFSTEEWNAILDRFPTHVQDVLREKEETIARFELFFQRYSQGSMNREIMEHQIRSHVLDWTRFELESVSFPTRDAAMEAALCIQEDSKSLKEVAFEAKQQFMQNSIFLDRMEPELKSQCVGAKKGDLVGPFPEGKSWKLFVIQNKSIPSIEDTEIRKLAQENHFKAIIENEINNRVIWHKRY